MSTEMQTKVQASPTQNFTPVQTGFLQRKCTLCNTPGLVADSELDEGKLTLQRSSVDQAGTTTVPRFGHDFSRVSVHSTGPGMIQAKLKINEPGDIYEQEADSVAEQVMRMPDPVSVPQSPVNSQSEGSSIQSAVYYHEKDIQRKEDDYEEEGIVQMKQGSLASGAGGQPSGAVPPIVHEVLHSPGVPLDPATRIYMEPRFGHDFSRVRVHTSAVAEQSAQDINASAYTMGHSIVFGVGRFTPGTHQGRRLIAHELTHVVQQSQRSGLHASPVAAESEAAWGAAQIAMGQTSAVHTIVAGGIQRQAFSREQGLSPLSEEELREKQLAGEAISGVPSGPISSRVPYKKSGYDVESTYRRAGLIEAANAVRRCRKLGDCTKVLTEAEASAAYHSGRLTAGLGEPKPETHQGQVAMAGVVAAPAPVPGAAAAAAETAAVKTALERAAELGWMEGGATTAEVAPAASVATVAIPIAIGVFITVAVIDLIGYTSFQGALHKLGYVILPDPLGVCIGLCHSAPRGRTLPRDWPKWEPIDLMEQIEPVVPTQPYPPLPLPLPPQQQPPSQERIDPQPKPSPTPPKQVTPPEHKTIDVIPPIETKPKEEEEKCTPTGLTRNDPIPFEWYKPRLDDWYPPEIELQGRSYSRDERSTLPYGEPIGVAEKRWPWTGKLVQLAPDCGVPRRSSICPNSSRFRRILRDEYGFNWGGRRYLQADHVQDVQWADPSGDHLDVFENLWPMDASANTSTGSLQNLHQRITFCESYAGPRQSMTIGRFMALGRLGFPHYGRYFTIVRIARGPV